MKIIVLSMDAKSVDQILFKAKSVDVRKVMPQHINFGETFGAYVYRTGYKPRFAAIAVIKFCAICYATSSWDDFEFYMKFPDIPYKKEELLQCLCLSKDELLSKASKHRWFYLFKIIKSKVLPANEFCLEDFGLTKAPSNWCYIADE